MLDLFDDSMIIYQGGKIYGVTIRVGRYAKGMADMVDDLLFNHHTATGSGALV